MKHWSRALGAVAVVCLLAWLGGFDFDERGEGAFVVGIWVVLAAIVTHRASKLAEPKL